MRHVDPAAAQDTKFRTHRHKTKFVQRFRHVRQSFAARKLSRSLTSSPSPSPASASAAASANKPDPIASLPSTYSIHEFHNYSFQSTGISPGLHFHLAASINALTDIPLVPAMSRAMAKGGTDKAGHNFVLHWMNNKEMEFSCQAVKILEDMFKLANKNGNSQNFEQELMCHEHEQVRYLRKTPRVENV